MTAALAKTVLHFIWEGAFIASALAFVLQIVRPASAKIRYGLAGLAMLAMLAAFGATLVHFWPRVQPAPLIVQFGWRGVLSAGTLDPVAPAPADPLWYVTAAWSLGAAAFSLRSVASWLGAQRLRRIGVCAAPQIWQSRLQQLAARIRVSRPVMLLESGLAEVPVVIGCWRPVILIPAGLLTGFPPEQIEYFLIHELAHVRRWDYLLNLLQTAAENLLFYHPAVWWVSKVVRVERENCCDDVVAAMGDVRAFASALATLERTRGTLGQPALAVSGGDLAKRIRRLLGRPEPRRSVAAPALLALLVIVLAAGLAAPRRQIALAQDAAPTFSPDSVPRPPIRLAQTQSKNPPATVGVEQAIPTYTPPLPAPYANWVNEEVVYIISDAERQAFRNLRTDEERQQFIQQFWLRRDPTPDTPQNELQDEHYRRIAYTDQNFSAGNVPGWKTDRGRVYIKFGPPDEKETHDESTPRKELWQYRFIQGMGTNVLIEFVADPSTGEYRMTTDPSALPTAALPPAGDQPFVNGGGRGRNAAQFLMSDPAISIRPQAAGNVTAVHVSEGQTVSAGQPLIDLDSNNPPFDKILSPAAGVVRLGSLRVGQHLEAGQELLQISRPTRTYQMRTGPLSYTDAVEASLQYQAGFESAFLQLRSNADRNTPALKALEDAARESDRVARAQASSPAQVQAALDQLRSAVANARTARLGPAAAQSSAPVPVAPWWAPDPQAAASIARAIEVTAKIQPDGTAQEVTVTRSTDPSFNQSAVDAVQNWKFPTLRGGQETYLIKVLVDPNKLARR